MANFGKEQWIAPGTLWTGGATSCGWQQCCVVSRERGIGNVEKNFPFNPFAQHADGDGFRLFVLEDGCRSLVLWETFGKSAALVIRLLCGQLHNNRYVAMSVMLCRALVGPFHLGLG